jgi:SAM-dependent methyltransferase
MRRPMAKSQNVTERVRGHFRKAASSFDALYDEDRLLQRSLRPALFQRRELALDVVRSHGSPSVLDVGCGSGRVGESVLEAGASRYVGIDFSEPMIELGRDRLGRFGDRAELMVGDFLETPLEEEFDVVLGLGLFDYIPEPDPFARRMGERCSGSLVASFPRWSRVKGPVRKLRYEMANNCPIFDYTEEGIRSLFTRNGFDKVTLTDVGKSALLAHAEVATGT